MVALDQVVLQLPFDMLGAVEVRITALIDLPDDPSTSMRLFGADRDRAMQSDPLDRLAEKSFGGLRNPPVR